MEVCQRTKRRSARYSQCDPYFHLSYEYYYSSCEFTLYLPFTQQQINKQKEKIVPIVVVVVVVRVVVVVIVVLLQILI